MENQFCWFVRKIVASMILTVRFFFSRVAQNRMSYSLDMATKFGNRTRTGCHYACRFPEAACGTSPGVKEWH